VVCAQICHSKSGDINPAKIQSYVAACVAQMDGGQGQQQQQKPVGKSSDDSKSKQASQAKKNPAVSHSPKTASKSGNSNNSKSKTADKSAKPLSNDDVSKLLKHVST
jgi:hypothetical protein